MLHSGVIESRYAYSFMLIKERGVLKYLIDFVNEVVI